MVEHKTDSKRAGKTLPEEWCGTGMDMPDSDSDMESRSNYPPKDVKYKCKECENVKICGCCGKQDKLLSKRKRDPNRPKKDPSSWQLFVRERVKGKTFSSVQERANHLRECGAEYRHKNKKTKANE